MEDIRDNMEKLPKIVAVDFDGTLVEDEFPGIGKPIDWIFNLCKSLKNSGVKLILWTSRDNDTPERHLDQAVDFCRARGLTFDAVNQNIPEVINLFHSDTRKVYANFYIDDKVLHPDMLPFNVIERFLKCH